MTTITRSSDTATLTPDLVLTEWADENEPQTIVHRILGRQDVVVTLRPALDATGTMRLFFLTLAAAREAQAFHRAAATFTTDGSDERLPAEYVPRRIRKAQQPDNSKRWIVEIEFQELTP